MNSFMMKRVIKLDSECHDSLDNCTEAFEYEYDDNGNVIEQKVFNYD